MLDRTYKGDRKHEGTDIMPFVNKRDYFPVVSMTDGIVTSVGWLELGGYRVGITSPGGAYFYYAHLSSYAGIKEGDPISCGRCDRIYGRYGIQLKEKGQQESFLCTYILEFIFIKTEKKSVSIHMQR